jgi:adenylate kinase family enzyme
MNTENKNKKEKISLEEINRKLEGFEFPDFGEPKAEQSATETSPYIDAAAVMVFYEPSSIRPVVPVPEDQFKSYINELIGLSDVVVDTSTEITDGASKEAKHKNYKILFVLKDYIRKITLDKLVKEGRIHEAITANREITEKSESPAQRLLTKYLMGETIELEQLQEDELAELYRINSWLQHIAAPKKYTGNEIRDRIEFVEMLRPFRLLTGVVEGGVFKNKFSGRQNELSDLRSYVGVDNPKGIKETVQRWVSSLFSQEKKPLLLFGIGGVGKSTLLAKFILEHLEAQKTFRFPYVYLDFDRPNLSALEPETLLIEASRQLSIQYRDAPDLSLSFADFYKKWIGHFDVLLESASSNQINISSEKVTTKKSINKYNLVKEFEKLLKDLYKHEKKPFLIVLDTFEEVQYKGSEFVNAVLDFSEMLVENFPLTRIVISGRSPVDKKRLYELEVGNLDIEAAIQFVIKNGVSNDLIAKNIAKELGGNPLTLKLATNIIKEQGTAALDDFNTSAGFSFFKKRLPELQIQGMLYERILAHIKNKEVQKIAHPGMTLRKITPELILKVLAIPCKLDNMNSISDAEILFKELRREVALITMVNKDTVKHRSDVRKVMLKLIMASTQKDTAMEIHRAAVKFYSNRNHIADKAEEFYHRLALGESPRELDSRWIDGVEDLLTPNLDELPEKARTFLMAKAGIESLDTSVWHNAEVEDQNTHLSKQAADLLNAGRPERVLNLLKQNAANKTPALKLIEVRALRQLKKFNLASEISKEALGSYYVDDLPAAIRNEFIKYSTESLSSDDSTPSPDNDDELFEESTIITV